MSLYNLLTESRIDDIKRKFPELSNDEINNIISLDPTPTKKYIFWLAKQQDLGYTLASATKDLLIDWEKNINRFTYKMLQDFSIHYDFRDVIIESNYKDINNYTLQDVNNIVSYLKKIPTRSEVKNIIKQETNKVFEGNVDGYDIVVIQPLTYNSSCLYGASTRWCTASKNNSYYFEQHINEGELYYIIFKDKNYLDKPDGKPSFKYAIFFRNNDTVEIYDERDRLILHDEFFTKFPGIRDIFKNKFPLTVEQILDKLSRGGNFGLQQRRLFKQLTNIIEDDKNHINVSVEANDKIKLTLSDECIENIFVIEDSRHYVYAGMHPNSYHENIYDYDSYTANEDFDAGYIFWSFNDEMWDKLLEYFEVVNFTAADIIKNIKNNKGDERVLFENLANIFNEEINKELKEDIINYYYHANDEAINAEGDKKVGEAIFDAIYAFFSSICQEPFEMPNMWNIEVSIYDIMGWYENHPAASMGNWTLYKLFKELNIDLTYGLYDLFEYYGTGEMDMEVFHDIFDNDMLKAIDSAIDTVLYNENDLIEYYKYRNEVLEKTKSLGIEFNKEYMLPDKKHVMIINLVPANELNIAEEPDKIFKVTISNTENNKTKTAEMTLDRIINLKAIYPAFDVIDEVYNIFNKIKH